MKITQILFLLVMSIAFFQCSSDPAAGGEKAAKAAKFAPAKGKANAAKGNKPRVNKNQELLNKLKLNPEQQQKYAAINKKYNKQGAEFRQANKGKREAIQANMKAITQAKKKELQALLSPEQFKIYTDATGPGAKNRIMQKKKQAPAKKVQ